jgi:hypothetical protein
MSLTVNYSLLGATLFLPSRGIPASRMFKNATDHVAFRVAVLTLGAVNDAE